MIKLKFCVWGLAVLLFIGMSACQTSKNVQPSETVAASPPKLSKRETVKAKVVEKALTYVGAPYRYGGTNAKGFDCSGLIYTAYSSVGQELPRTSASLAKYGRKQNKTALAPGDLVFFSAKGRGGIDHVGMVTQVAQEKVEFIHATVSRGVRLDRLDVGYWKDRYIKATTF